ncbi:sulfite exporter TauE/SafE family protein [Actinomycetospora sp. CA-101289]|uniref:sulfite exporter TauE/SafE family protein n=1 Tax=Actinomycetospora sp. CA-101289 TaxID=3239893 RepID=UPI003D95D776
MTWWHGVIIAIAGVWAGTINTVVGSGTLVTFPVLVALGYPPVTATTSNAIGLVPGSITGAYGYRAEIAGSARRLARWSVASALGAVGGTALLLSLPEDAFETIVPFLVGLALLLVVVQPLLTRRLQGTRADARPRWLLMPLIFLIGVYGGYFTAAQGILLVGVMGLLLDEPLQRLNGYKNVLAAVVNVVAGAVYAVVAPISWPVVAILAVSSTIGGLLGARIGRRLSPTVLRVVIVVVGLIAIVRLVLE